MKKNTKIKKSVIIISALSMILSLPGCWDSQELDKLAIVQGVGIDIDSSDPEKVQLTVQIVNPREISPANTDSQGSSGKASLNISSTGSTVFEAIKELNGRTSRDLFWPHNEILIIGRSIAESGIEKYLDFFMRDHETRGKIQIAVADTTSAEILNAENRLEQLSAEETAALIEEYANTTALSKSVKLNEFVNQYMISGTGTAPILSVKTEEDSNYVDINGIAVLKDMRMIGQLDDTESRGFMWVNDNVKSCIVKVTDSTNGAVDIEIVHASTKVSAKKADNEIQISVECHIKGNIGEQHDTLDLSSLKETSYLRNAAEENISKEIKTAISRAQSMNADIFDFGSAIKRQYPENWHTMEGRWDELFPSLIVNVKVRADLQLMGKIIRPIKVSGEENEK